MVPLRLGVFNPKKNDIRVIALSRLMLRIGRNKPFQLPPFVGNLLDLGSSESLLPGHKEGLLSRKRTKRSSASSAGFRGEVTEDMFFLV